MKILVICQHYWPEPYPLPDLAEELVKRGHIVHVITDVPNYPMGETYTEYKKHKNREEIHNGVKIIRCFTIPRKHNVIFRILNYYSYAISSSQKVKYLKDDYDVVLAYQTSPVMMSKAAISYGRKYNKKIVMYCLDLWPASLVAGGLSVNSSIYKIFSKVSKKIYSRMDKLLISSSMFKNYFMEQHGIEEDKIEYLPQYANSAFDEKAIVTSKSVNDLSAKKTIDVMFAGNIGVAQSMPTIIGAAEKLKDIENLHWHIVGDGSELENTKQLVKEKQLSNVIFHGRKPVEEMPEFYAMADAMLVTLTADEFASLTLPGKVQTYMTTGKPIIASANGETKDIIEQAHCGFCGKAESSEELAEAVKKFINYDNKLQLGQNAKSFYDEHFTKEKFVAHLEQVLEEFRK